MVKGENVLLQHSVRTHVISLPLLCVACYPTYICLWTQFIVGDMWKYIYYGMVLVDYFVLCTLHHRCLKIDSPKHCSWTHIGRVDSNEAKRTMQSRLLSLFFFFFFFFPSLPVCLIITSWHLGAWEDQHACYHYCKRAMVVVVVNPASSSLPSRVTIWNRTYLHITT